MNAIFEWPPLFTAEKLNERPGLNEHPPLPPSSNQERGAHLKICNVRRGGQSEIFKKYLMKIGKQ